MTTDCFTTYDLETARTPLGVTHRTRELIAAGVTAAGYILLLPAAVLLMSFLTV